MKVVIDIKIDRPIRDEIILFEARRNQLTQNFGNPVGVTVDVVSASDDYVQLCGDFNHPWSRYSAFLADCVHHDFEVIKINDKDVSIDPFKDIFKVEKIESQRIEIELIKK